VAFVIFKIFKKTKKNIKKELNSRKINKND